MEVSIKKVPFEYLRLFKQILIKKLISIMKSKDLKIISKTFSQKVSNQTLSKTY